MNLAIIPARGGSKRIPRKNIIDFCGNPMITYPLKAVAESRIFDLIHISTDSEEIKGVAEKAGFPIDFMRDPSLCDDFTGLIPVLRWVVQEYEKRGRNIDNVCCVYPASPLLLAGDLKEAFSLYTQNSGRYPVITVTEYPAPIEWAYRRKDGFLKAVDHNLQQMRSQDLEMAYYECASFFILSRVHLFQDAPMAGNLLSHIVPKERAVDIDTMADLSFAEKLYNILRN